MGSATCPNAEPSRRKRPPIWPELDREARFHKNSAIASRGRLRMLQQSGWEAPGSRSLREGEGGGGEDTKHRL